MGTEVGQTFIVENKRGAAGTIGMALASRATPDGYTVVMTSNPPLTVNMYLQKDFPYDSTIAIAPISLVADSLLVLTVNASLPVHSLQEWITYAKANGPLLQDLVAGVIPVGRPTALVPFANAGKLRVFALAEQERRPDFPGVPTIRENAPGVVTNTWFGFLASAANAYCHRGSAQSRHACRTCRCRRRKQAQSRRLRLRKGARRTNSNV